MTILVKNKETLHLRILYSNVPLGLKDQQKIKRGRQKTPKGFFNIGKLYRKDRIKTKYEN